MQIYFTNKSNIYIYIEVLDSYVNIIYHASEYPLPPVIYGNRFL